MIPAVKILIALLLAVGGCYQDTPVSGAPVYASVQSKKKAPGKPKAKPSKPAAPKTSADAKKRRKQTEQQMKKTAAELQVAEAELSRNLRQVTKLESDIERSTAVSARLKARIDSLNTVAREVKDSITAGRAELERLRGLYTRAVRSSRKNRREMSATTFIFSARTFRQAWRRMRYLEEFSNWRKRKTEEIGAVIESLEQQQLRLEQMKVKVQNLRREALNEERRLRRNRQSLADAVGNLRGKQKELNAMLKRQQSTLRELDRQIERLIEKEIEEQRRREAEEARKRAEAEAKAKKSAPSEKPVKPAAATFTPGATATNSPGNFAAQKGKLPSPLSHTYVVVQGFGIQQHRSIKTLEFNNPGVDLETAAGATARAIYPGVVSAVFRQEGLGHVVLIRHGEYLTVYANIKSLRVTKGDKLKTGDVIGTVGPGDTNPDRAQLHFEIRREREKINPMQWLKR